MTILHFSLDFNSSEWSMNVTYEHPVFHEICIGFKNSTNDLVVFDNLSFTVRLGGEIWRWPKPGVSYISTDQPYIEKTNISLDNQKNYTFLLTAINNGVTYEGVFDYYPKKYEIST